MARDRFDGSRPGRKRASVSLLASARGLFRRFRSRVLRSPVRLEGRCNLCGRCCSHILLMNDGRWIRSEKTFRAIVESSPRHGRFTPVGRNDEGLLTFDCRCLGKDNLCTSYADRPALCRNYPSKSLYYQGGQLLSDCGFTFKAMTFRQAAGRLATGRRAFSKVLEKEVRKDAEPKKEDTDS